MKGHNVPARLSEIRQLRAGLCSLEAAAPDAPGIWPPGISYRVPDAIDGDRKGNVQVLTSDGWELARWDDVVLGAVWQHTPSWTLRQRADELLNNLVFVIGSRQSITPEIQQLVAGIRAALEGLP